MIEVRVIGRASDDGNLDDGDGCDPQCRVPGTPLWDVVLPPMSMCPVDVSGTELWHTTIEVGAVANGDVPRHVAVSGDATFVIGESRTETGNLGFLVEYDAAGAELWQTYWLRAFTP